MLFWVVLAVSKFLFYVICFGFSDQSSQFVSGLSVLSYVVWSGIAFSLCVSLVLYSDESSDFWCAPRLASGFGFGLVVMDSMLNSMDDVFELVIDRHVGIGSIVDCSDDVG